MPPKKKAKRKINPNPTKECTRRGRALKKNPSSKAGKELRACAPNMKNKRGAPPPPAVAKKALFVKLKGKRGKKGERIPVAENQRRNKAKATGKKKVKAAVKKVAAIQRGAARIVADNRKTPNMKKTPVYGGGSLVSKDTTPLPRGKARKQPPMLARNKKEKKTNLQAAKNYAANFQRAIGAVTGREQTVVWKGKKYTLKAYTALRKKQRAAAKKRKAAKATKAKRLNPMI